MMCASAVGRSFELDILAEIAGIPEYSVCETLRRACDLQIVVSSGAGRYAFRHALTRDIVYAECLSVRSRALHRRIARALERSRRSGATALADLAYHAWAARDARRALRYNERAGDDAAAVHATGDARRYYLRARSVIEIGSSAYERLNEKLRALRESDAR